MLSNDTETRLLYEQIAPLEIPQSTALTRLRNPGAKIMLYDPSKQFSVVTPSLVHNVLNERLIAQLVSGVECLGCIDPDEKGKMHRNDNRRTQKVVQTSGPSRLC